MQWSAFRVKPSFAVCDGTSLAKICSVSGSGVCARMFDALRGDLSCWPLSLVQEKPSHLSALVVCHCHLCSACCFAWSVTFRNLFASSDHCIWSSPHRLPCPFESVCALSIDYEETGRPCLRHTRAVRDTYLSPNRSPAGSCGAPRTLTLGQVAAKRMSKITPFPTTAIEGVKLKLRLTAVSSVRRFDVTLSRLFWSFLGRTLRIGITEKE